MKAIGIIRRIDDLGRVVIPKEIRRNMRITEGSPLEIFVEGDGVLFKPYFPTRDISHMVQELKQFISEEQDVKNRAYLFKKNRGYRENLRTRIDESIKVVL